MQSSPQDPGAYVDPSAAEKLFRHRVFAFLPREERISLERVDPLVGLRGSRAHFGGDRRFWRVARAPERPHPRRRRHRTLFYGEYSNRVRGSGHPVEAETPAREEPKPRKRCPPSWARLIAKVYQADPLLCIRCGKRMSLVAFVTDQIAIRRILDHLGLSTPQAGKPPPPEPEILRVAEHGDVWGVPAEWE